MATTRVLVYEHLLQLPVFLESDMTRYVSNQLDATPLRLLNFFKGEDRKAAAPRGFQQGKTLGLEVVGFGNMVDGSLVSQTKIVPNST